MRAFIRRALPALAVTLVLAITSGCTAADPPLPEQFAGTLYLAHPGTFEDIAAGTEMPYDFTPRGLVAPGDIDGKFPIPAGATAAESFISPRGKENEPSEWNAFEVLGQLQTDGTWHPPVGPFSLINPGPGNPSGTLKVQEAGGDYSIGLAYTADNGLTVVDDGLYFVHIHVTPESGEYTWEPVDSGS